MTIITRFAPSPTGFLHVGNMRTAIISWLHARVSGGKFVLRIDDTDTARSKKEYEDEILADLKWMGINWDQMVRQSDRFDKYEAAKQKLIADGRLYKCFETQEEIDLKRKVLINRGLPPIYDREALTLTAEQITKLEASGRKPHWRFKLDHGSEISWHDGVRGDITFQPDKLSDPVLIRENGTLTYSLASVVDDIDLNITDIIRGEDHISNSAIHIQLFEALGAKAPSFSHVSLLKTKESGMSKREGGFEIQKLREQGVLPLPLMSYLSTLGSSSDLHEEHKMSNIINSFAISKFGKALCNYHEGDVIRVNQHYIHNMKYEEVKPMLDELGLEIDQHFWYAIHGNINTLAEVNDWIKVCKDKVTPVIEDADYCEQIKELLPHDLDADSWSKWTSLIKEKTGRKGGALFMPIRLALTSKKDGPELKKMLQLIGRDKIIARLSGETA